MLLIDMLNNASPTPAATCAATASPAPVYEYVAPATVVTDLESVPEPPVPVVHIAPTPATMCAAPAPDVTHAAPAHTDLVSPAPAHVAPSFSNLVNPQSSTACVETFAPKEIGSRLCAPVNHAYQEQIVAARTTQNIVGPFSVLEMVKVQEIPELQVIERGAGR